MLVFRNFWLLCYVACCGLTITGIAGYSGAATAAGYQIFSNENLQVHVWYPTDTPPASGRLGPFDVKQSANAPLRPGSYGIVLMSHGFNGRVRNHHLTAQALADAGFVVIAPLHAADFYVDSKHRAAALAWRVAELSHAIELVMQNGEFRRSMDLSNIQGIGYSLGTATMMMASGAGFSLTDVNNHCDSQNDPAFCEPLGMFARWMVRKARGIEVYKPTLKIPQRFFPKPIITGKIALIAPIGKGLIVEESGFRAKGVFVLGFAKDDTNVFIHHTAPYRELIPSGRLDHYVIDEEGSHAAFIAPFAKRVTDIEHIDVAIDPPGFDRRAFLDDLNARIVSYFLAQ